jgi:hypothetical protein
VKQLGVFAAAVITRCCSLQWMLSIPAMSAVAAAVAAAA